MIVILLVKCIKLCAEVPDLEGVLVAAGARGDGLGQTDFAVERVDDELCFI